MEKFVAICVGSKYYSDQCECEIVESLDIINSYGYSLETLNDFYEQINAGDNDVWLKYAECIVDVVLTYSDAQIGDYPPPNVEVPAYWDWEVVRIERWFDMHAFEKELYNSREYEMEW